MKPLRWGAVLALALPTSVLLPVTAVPAHAVTSYTWKGEQDSSWSTPANWDPMGVPANGDSVVLGPVGPAGTPAVTGVPDVSLGMLSVSGSPDQAVSLSGDGNVIVGNLQWSGGDISVDLTVSAPPLDPNPSIITPGQTPLRFGYGGQQTLTLLSSVEMPLGLGAGEAPWLTFMFDSSVRIGSTATLRIDPAASLAANRCCSSPTSTVVVDGTLEVFSIIGATGYTAHLDHLGLDVAGVVDVPPGNTLQVVGGPVRVGGTATNGTVGDGSLRGGGTVDLVETQGDAFDPAHPTEPDTTMKFLDVGETLTLAESTTLTLGDFATVSGVGRITGDGSVRLAGADLRGELRLDDGIDASTVAGTDTRLVHADSVRGQHGLLTPAGGLRVVPGSTLSVASGTRVVVPDGADLALPAGSVLASGSCCNDPGRVTVQHGGTLAIGAGAGAPTVLRYVELGGAGAVTHRGRSEWDLAGTAFTSGSTLSGSGTIDGDLPAGALTVTPAGVLKVTGDYTANAGGSYVATLPGSRSATSTGRLEVGGTARLAGRLVTRGSTRFPAGRSLLALKAGAVSGRFGCSETPGFLPSYAGRSVSLSAIDLRTTGCLVPSSGLVLRARFAGARTASLGVPTQATRVLLDVTLGRAAGAHRVTLSGGRGAATTLRAAAGRSSRDYVVVSVTAARRLTARTDRRAAVSITRVGWY
ncbi:hypothetical protein BH11ACT8_BH11ACT8_28640 [soil metagenome]